MKKQAPKAHQGMQGIKAGSCGQATKEPSGSARQELKKHAERARSVLSRESNGREFDNKAADHRPW